MATSPFFSNTGLRENFEIYFTIPTGIRFGEFVVQYVFHSFFHSLNWVWAHDHFDMPYPTPSSLHFSVRGVGRPKMSHVYSYRSCTWFDCYMYQAPNHFLLVWFVNCQVFGYCHSWHPFSSALCSSARWLEAV